jgi:ATP-dependent DNA helicase RecG
VFFLAGYIESWGRGIEKIAAACEGHGIPMPEFDSSLSGLTLTFRASETYLALIQRPKDAPPQPISAVETTQKTREKGSEKSSEKSSEKIIRLILDNPSIAAQSIANQMGLTSRTVEKHLSTLKAKGRIRRVGPDKGGHWEVLKTSGNENADSPSSS